MKNLTTILAIGLMSITLAGCAAYDGSYRTDRDSSLKKGEYYGRDGRIHIFDGSRHKY
jgi:hypothetical protein